MGIPARADVGSTQIWQSKVSKRRSKKSAPFPALELSPFHFKAFGDCSSQSVTRGPPQTSPLQPGHAQRRVCWKIMFNQIVLSTKGPGKEGKLLSDVHTYWGMTRGTQRLQQSIEVTLWARGTRGPRWHRPPAALGRKHSCVTAKEFYGKIVFIIRGWNKAARDFFFNRNNKQLSESLPEKTQQQLRDEQPTARVCWIQLGKGGRFRLRGKTEAAQLQREQTGRAEPSPAFPVGKGLMENTKQSRVCT